MTVVLSAKSRPSYDSECLLTPADLTPKPRAALDMGCHMPEVYSDDRPGVSIGVAVWAFGSVFGALVIGLFCLLAGH